ncbi:Protoheme ferro-lyase (ferrochelatase) [Gloeomargarita lithophora Alchichica-D10]|uniref:Protoheme ferro-lyase (Ferrochelatase) n=1 Tax=Gloeomargarita lithophora Alchichica-D10 TaxID=1188229 RepID=A0A1J0AFL2_9CYAN|nr:chlorophyll a/b-binding protein [Gloeomargarita lithophora]APB34709.1 Protoheme ferro-lyase (ferrochelatase) [Gloeomargarita lithophora Alchichica-D10]
MGKLMEKFNVNPTGAGTFGFTHFAEVWNGRLAMVGIICLVAGEVTTGKGQLAQMGIVGRGAGLLVVLLLVGLTVASMLGYYAVGMAQQMALTESENSTTPVPAGSPETAPSAPVPTAGTPTS